MAPKNKGAPAASFTAADVENGEVTLRMVENCTRWLPNATDTVATGNLWLTNYRLIFVPAGSQRSPLGFIPHLPDLCSTALAHISSIKSSRDKGVFTLSLQTSDLQRIIFTLSDEPRGATDTFLDSLSQYAFSGNVERLFAFDYRPSPSHRGAVYDASAELARWRTSSGAWRVSAVNSAFAVCPAYGPALIVPAAVEDSAAVNAAKSFSAHRLPALAWGSDQSLLVRSGRFTDSDTPIGRAAGRAYLGALGNGPWAALSLEAHPEGSVPLGGADVPLASLSVKVPSVDRIAAAWSALSTLCLQPTSKDDTRFFTDLDASKWPLTVTRFLAAANRVADLLTAKTSVLLVQEDASPDRACIIASLAQVLVDPYYRTINGLAVLIQKEWLSHGFPFGTRHAWAKKSGRALGAAFLVFCDALHQLVRANPRAFEYDDSLLLFVADHARSGAFGDFLFDSAAERAAAKADGRTACIWDAVATLRAEKRAFVNPLFDASETSAIHAAETLALFDFWAFNYARGAADHVGAEEVRVRRAGKAAAIKAARQQIAAAQAAE